jgi:ferredoxin-thioredoxin reductase catalytic subunit
MFHTRPKTENIETENLCVAILYISNEESEAQYIPTITEGALLD